MVDGVKMVFKKELMLKRIKEQGRINSISVVELAIMDNLDGQEVRTCWNRQVKGDPVYACTGKDGITLNVYEGDCE